MPVRDIIGLLLLSAAPSLAQVISSDFNSLPTDEGWNLVFQSCDPPVGVVDNQYVQPLDSALCPKGQASATDAYRRPVDEFNGVLRYFLEFKVSATGPREEIIFGAPIVLANPNSFGISYTATVSRDQVKLTRDALLPNVFVEVPPSGFHTIRVELQNDPPATYKWYVDGQLVDEGEAEGPFPADNSRITWQGRSKNFPTVNRFDYIRYGVLPQNFSGDWDSDSLIDDNDAPFFAECLLGPGIDAGPGCRWADFDADTDVDCADRDAFIAAWTGANNPPPLPNCTGLAPIPAVSQWGVVVLMLSLGIAGSVVFKRHLLLQS